CAARSRARTGPTSTSSTSTRSAISPRWPSPTSGRRAAATPARGARAGPSPSTGASRWGRSSTSAPSTAKRCAPPSSAPTAASGRARGTAVRARWPLLPPRADTIRHRLIFALDVETLSEAERLVELLREAVGVFKIGKQLFLHAGPEVVRMVHRHGAEVFLD